MIGKKFNRLLVIKKAPTQNNRLMWETKCDCGNFVIVSGTSLRIKHSKSCGCLQKEICSKLTSQRNFKHGLYKSFTLEHVSWACMQKRCFYKKHKHYKYYGGRGITVCKRWKKFENFLKDMGKKPTPKHSIDRVNNDKGYYPKNCRWATAKEQRANQRKRKCAK